MKMERKERSPEAVGKKKKKRGNKKRFSDKQIRYLESTFQEETKLEPERKLELAKELGLEPRQVAIWFQNRRARWKSKQLEQDYAVLRASYDELASRIDSIQKEKQCLLKQLQTLKNLVENGSINGDSHHRETKCCESEEKPTLLLEEVADMEEFGVEEQGLVNNPETANGFLTLIDDWCEFDSCCFSDQSSSSLSWWELWP